jgi:hypothetical protein
VDNVNFRRLKMLDERAVFAGLGMIDVSCAAVFLALLSTIFKTSHYKIVIWPIDIMFVGALVAVRRGKRTGIIRSFVKARLRGQVIYDPKRI